jgi:hypothetical protein
MQVSPFARRPARAASTRRRFTLLLSLLLVAALVPFVTHGAGGGPQEDDPAPTSARARAGKSRAPAAEFVPGRVLVRFRSEAAARLTETPRTGRALMLGGADTEIAAHVERFEGSDLVRGLRLAYVEPAETMAAIEAFESMPDVLYAEPDYVRHLTRTPNDPRLTSGELFGLQKINAPGAWDTTTGSNGVVVGVIDEGIDVNHPDLAANIWTNPGEIPNNGVDDDGNGKIDDVNGWDFFHNDKTVFDSASGDEHATHVAGTIGARGDNGIGVVGVNWQVSLMSLKVLDGRPANSGGGGGTTSVLLAAYQYALMMKQRGVNLRVLNNSYGGSGSSQSELAAIRALGDSGILFVAAAGNASTNNDFIPLFPANYDAQNLLAVASTDSNDNISSFSNIGARLVSVAAPGRGILSTTPNNTYTFINGTSMASPHVAGLAALVCSLEPQIDVLRLRSLVAYNGDVIAAAADKVYTRRRINAANSVLAWQEHDGVAPAAVGNLQKSAQNGRAVTLTFNAPGDNGNAGRAALYEVSFLTATGAAFVLKTAIPNPAGTSESISVSVPLRNTSGTLRVKAIDNAGNTSQADVSIAVDSLSADPYATSEAAAAGLDPLGSALNFRTDDGYRTVSLPPGFSFPFFGQTSTSVVLSSNGALYLQPQSTLPPVDPDNEQFGDSVSSAQQLEGFRMVAGLWDDLRTDCATSGSGSPCDVYMNTSDPNKVTFRWEARVFNDSANAGNPVQFEIELSRDGAVRTRYGAGNAGVQPVVGIGAGEQGGSYVITSHTFPNASSLNNAATVTFSPRLVIPDGGAVIGFTFSTTAATETQARAAISVTRTGNTQSSVSVDARTVDSPAAVRCDDTTTSPGVAFARCDYATTVTTIDFAPGETEKSFAVPVIDDAFVEPDETVQLVLSNPSAGARLGTQGTTTLTIFSLDQPGAPNPILTTNFFVRQQYLDFFGREPDLAGFTAWESTLNNCPDPFNTSATSPSANCDRVSVSTKFFRSKEFELKGRFVFNFYKAAFGRLPRYSEIIPDMAGLTAVDDAGFFAKKAAFTNSFVGRQEFKDSYDALTNQQFVDALMNRYGLQQITTPDPLNPDGSTKVTLTRSDMLARLNLGTLTRAQSVRAMADSDEVSAAEANSAFVAMQYFGYLRRDPEEGGYNDWLRTINANPVDIRSMVNGFMNSDEYRLRFGGQ